MEKKINKQRLILISNGEPYAHRNTGNEIECVKLAGGLTTGLDPLMKKDKGLWIAWGRGEADFEVVDKDDKVRVPDENGYTLKRINLSKKEQAGFYYGFSNEVMWPICHNFITKANFKQNYWETYKKVNEKYALSALEEITEDDLVWIHDYQLALIPGFIKEKKKNTKVAMFWHIPWPAWEAFRTIPWQEIILKKMLKSDFIAFHTPLFVNNFIDCTEKLGADVDRTENIVNFQGQATKVMSIPLGIDYQQFQRQINENSLNEKAKKIKEDYHAEKIVFAVDRLDYTKGILKRLKAMDKLFERYPEHIGKVTMVQRISPSRTEVEEYQQMRESINKKIAEINGKYQKDEWVPIKYFYGSVPQKELLPYFRAADIALITPLIDGMNLVAKEFLAVQNKGMLILSEFAGAAIYLDDALLVNPYDINAVTEAIQQGLEMSQKEKELKLTKLKEEISKYDINWWRNKFLAEWVKRYD